MRAATNESSKKVFMTIYLILGFGCVVDNVPPFKAFFVKVLVLLVS